jgi:hypothetical protein
MRNSYFVIYYIVSSGPSWSYQESKSDSSAASLELTCSSDCATTTKYASQERNFSAEIRMGICFINRFASRCKNNATNRSGLNYTLFIGKCVCVPKYSLYADCERAANILMCLSLNNIYFCRSLLAGTSNKLPIENESMLWMLKARRDCCCGLYCDKRTQ